MVGILLLVAALGAAPAAKPADLAQRGRAKMKALEYEAALPLLLKAVASPELKGPARATALVDLGITQLNLEKPQDARESFRLALETDPAVPLPKGASPKIRALFAEVQQAQAAPPPPPLVETRPEPVPEPKPEPAADPVVATEPTVRTVEATTSDKPLRPVAEVTEEARPTPTRKIAGYALLGAGVAVAAGGGACLGVSWSKKADYDAGKLPQGEVETAKTLSTAGVAMISIGAASLVTGLVLALLPTQPDPADPQVLVVPTPHGAAALVSFQLP